MDCCGEAPLMLLLRSRQAVYDVFTASSSLSAHLSRRCDCLKIAMIKNQHLAAKLFGGNVYDCVCKFEMARQTPHR